MTLPHTNPVQDESAGPAKVQLLDLAGGGAFDALGFDQAPAGQRTLVKSGTIFSTDDNALLSEFRALRALTGKRARLYRRAYATGEVEWSHARLVRIGSTRNVGDRHGLNVDLEFFLISPVWNGERHGNGWYLDAGEILDSGLVVDEDGDTILCDNATVTGVVTNGGNAAVKNPTITFTCGSSPLTNLAIRRIVDSVTKEHINIGLVLYWDNVLVINCNAKTVTIEGPDWEASTAYAENQSVIGTATDGVQRYYYCSVPGTSGGSEPTWPTTGSVVDGGVTWVAAGLLTQYNAFSYGAEHTTDGWITLEPGDNSIQIVRSGGSVASEAQFFFYDGWL